MARVIAVASAKGGVGKTTTTATLGTTLAAAGARVATIDADLGMANLASVLGINADNATVHDVLAGSADVEAAMYDGPEGLTVVPGDTDLAAFPNADPANLRSLLDEFTDFDYVLLDTGAGLSHDSILPLALADDVLLVTTPDPNAVGDTEKTRQVAERLDGSVAGVVVTSVDPNRLADGDVLAADIDAPVLATVPSSPLFSEATTTGEPVSLTAPTSDAAAAYRTLARELTSVDVPEPAGQSEEAEDSDDSDVETEADTADDSDDVATFQSDDEQVDENGDPSAVSDTDDGESADEGADSAEDDDDDAATELADTESVADADADETDSGDAAETADDGTDDTQTADSDTEAADASDDAVDAEADPAEDELDETAERGEAEAEEESDAEIADSTADEDDVLVPDAENGEPVDEVDQSDADDGGVHETSLVEEAEATDADDEDGDDDDVDDDGKSGFLSRLLG